MTSFFKAAAADVAKQLSEIMQTERVERADRSEVDAILEQINLESLGWAKLADAMLPAIEAAHGAGSVVALKQVGIVATDDITDLLNDRALFFAEARSAELVGMRRVGDEFIPNPDARWAITETTREMLRATVSEAIDQGWSTDKLAGEVAVSTAFSSSRAEMIARTEIAKADVEGNMQAYRESGVVMGKEWIVGSEHDDDDECGENAAAGVIPIDEPFPSGDDAAPAHPNCICDVLPVLIDKEGE